MYWFIQHYRAHEKAEMPVSGIGKVCFFKMRANAKSARIVWRCKNIVLQPSFDVKNSPLHS